MGCRDWRFFITGAVDLRYLRVIEVFVDHCLKNGYVALGKIGGWLIMTKPVRRNPSKFSENNERV